MNLSLNRALAALQGLALGDALGMPTQSMSPEEIKHYYGTIKGLQSAVPEQKIAPSMTAGSVTDDTEQALLLAELIVHGNGHIDPMDLATQLLTWEADMIARGSFDLLGPSTKLALEQIKTGKNPLLTGTTGTTNGAAMRVSPVGIAFDTTEPEALSAAVYESCMVTHNTTQGWEGAALVAATVSVGIDGYSTQEAIGKAICMVSSLKKRGHWSAKASVVARVKTALSTIKHLETPQVLSYLQDEVGTSVESTESIPAAIAIAYKYSDNPTQGLFTAANLGGDTDTIGAIAGAILGASTGTGAFNTQLVHQVEKVSKLQLSTLSEQLISLRHHTQ